MIAATAKPKKPTPLTKSLQITEEAHSTLAVYCEKTGMKMGRAAEIAIYEYLTRAVREEKEKRC